MENIDFVIDVHKLNPVYRDREYMFAYLNRCIPVGTTFTVLNDVPIFIWKGKLKKGQLQLDHPVTSVITYYIPLS